MEYKKTDKFNFAVELFNIPLPYRLDWLKAKLSDKMKENNFDFEQQREGIVYLNKLSGSINVKSR